MPASVRKHPLAPSWLAVPDDPNALPTGVFSSHVARDVNGELVVADVRASTLAEQFGTPLYVMDEQHIRRQAHRVKAAFDAAAERVGTTARVYYASKAFLSTEIASWVTSAGLGIDVASRGELAVALAAGVDCESIGVHGNNKSVSDIERAVGAGVGTIVLDAPIEIERVAEVAARAGVVQRVRLRVNSGVHAQSHEYLATAHEDQKFGIAIADAPDLVERIRQLTSLDFVGLHCHIGSQIFGVEAFVESARRLVELHARLSEAAPVAELNLGGGFGIAYTPADDPLPIEEIATGILDAVAYECNRWGIPIPRVAVEPGRIVVGTGGLTLYRVGVMKDVRVDLEPAMTEPALSEPAMPGEDGTAVRRYVSVDGGMSDNARPALYGANYTARIANRSPAGEPTLVRVVGQHCESGDVVVHADFLPQDVRPGDLLAVAATGAYCFSLASNYNYLARPPVVAVVNGTARVIVRGETEQDLLSRDVGINVNVKERKD